MATKKRDRKLGQVVWQQPLLLRETIQTNYDTRDTFLRSLPELEAAYVLCIEDPKLKSMHAAPSATKEALRFYNRVVKDGRYIEMLKTDPTEAASKLRVDLSAEANKVLEQGLSLRGARSRVNEFTVVTAIVATLALAVPEGEIVIDYSKQVGLKA